MKGGLPRALLCFLRRGVKPQRQGVSPVPDAGVAPVPAPAGSPLLSHPARRGEAGLQEEPGPDPHLHAGERVLLLRLAEPAAAHQTPLGAVCHRRGHDAVDLVRAAPAGPGDAHVPSADPGCGGGGGVCLPDRPGGSRAGLVLSSGPAHPGGGLRGGVLPELSPAGRTAVHPDLRHAVHRGSGPVLPGGGGLRGLVPPRGVDPPVVPHHPGDLHRAADPPAGHPLRAPSPGRGPAAVQPVKA